MTCIREPPLRETSFVWLADGLNSRGEFLTKEHPFRRIQASLISKFTFTTLVQACGRSYFCCVKCASKPAGPCSTCHGPKSTRHVVVEHVAEHLFHSVRSIKDFAEPRFFAILLLPMTAVVGRMMFVLARVSTLGVVGLCRGHRTCASGGPLNQLVEFTPVKPNASALRTVVNFNALAFGHQKT